MPSSDSHLLQWPRATIAHRTLPLPQNAYETAPSIPLSKQAFIYNHGPPTPPPSTSEMNGLPYPAQHHHHLQQQRAHEVSYPVRTNLPVPQAAVKPNKKPVQSTEETYIKSSPPGISNLVQGEPTGRQSPSHSNGVTKAFKLPSSINAPQVDLPTLAAEVSWPSDTVTSIMRLI